MNTLVSHYQHAVERLNATISTEKRRWDDPSKTREYFFERTQRWCAFFQHPERLFRVAHVAGTAGKGSTSAMLYNALVADGRLAGLYATPYVSCALENIQINGSLVDPVLFDEVVNEVLDRLDHYPDREEWGPSYGEISFMVGLLCMQRSGVEWLVLETAAGGRFDLTNVIPAPEVVLLTNVSLDHTELFGHTPAEIAWHKAGIIKNGARVFSTAQDPSVREVFLQEAQRAGVTMEWVQPSRHYSTAMPGEHQQWNAALAAAGARAVGASDAAISESIARTQLPARVEVVAEHPRVIIDGAHSAAKMQALVDTLAEFRPWKKLHLLFAAKESKDIHALVTPLAPLADTVTVSSFQLPAFGSIDMAATAEAFQRSNPSLPIHQEANPLTAIQAILAHAEPDDLIVVTGSLYFAGSVREYWYPVNELVAQRTLFPSAIS